MMHLAIYDSSLASGTTLLQVTAEPDTILAASGSGFLVGTLNKVIAGLVLSANSIRGQIQAASLRDQPFIDIVPANRSATPLSPVRLADFSRAPLALRTNEEVDFFAAQNAGIAQTVYGAIWFADAPPRPMNNIPHLTVHLTGATTLTAAAWSPVALTLDTTLQAGTYAVIGMRAFSATGLFARIVPNDGLGTTRPGVTAVQGYGDMDMPGARNGEWGQFTTFKSTSVPNVEFFATGADTAEEVWFDLVQLSATVT